VIKYIEIYILLLYSLMTTLYNYRLYCIEEAKFVNQWAETEPTICPNDHADRTINTSQTVITDTMGTNIVRTEEPTSGSFQHTTIKITVPSNPIGTITSHPLSWPMDLQMWKTEFYTTSEHTGDVINITVAPNSIVGVLTQPADIGDTTLNVSPTVVNNSVILKGIEITIDNTVISQKLGRITAFDTTLNTITISNPLTNDYAAGTFVKFNLVLLKDVILHRINEPHRVADKGFKAKKLPANTPIVIEYQNNTGLAKECIATLEYYYD
jgi:hypothetical protein